MYKFIILPVWFAIWITGVVVNDSEIKPWKMKYGANSTDSVWVCNYDSYPNFYRQFDSLITVEGRLDTIWQQQ